MCCGRYAPGAKKLSPEIKMKKNFFKSMGLFFKALPDVMIFELIYKLVLLAVGAPLLAMLLKYTMKVSHVRYLSDEKVWFYLRNPLTIAAILLILFFSAVFSFMELSGLAACYSCYSKGERLSIIGMFRTGFYAVKKAFKGRGIMKFLKFMIYLPMAQFTISSGVFLAPLLPILKDAFKKMDTNTALIIVGALQILFAIIIVSRSYSIHLLILTDKPFNECTKKSRALINNKRLRTVFSLILWSVFIIAAAAAVTFVISFIVMIFTKGISSPHKALVSTLKVLHYAGEIFTAIATFISTPAILCWLTGRFFADLPEDEDITLPERKSYMLSKPTKALLYSTLISVSLLLNYTYIEALYRGNISLNVGILTRTQVTAHRGFSKKAPENTLYAFEKALESGADYIELDVQLTKDGQLVVFHDEKLDRVTDGKGKLTEHTYDELQQLSAGSWFGKDGEFDDAKIPLLSEVFDLIDHDIMLNIEIKNRGDAMLTAEKTVELIKEYDFEDSCYVTSFSYAAIKRVKKLDPEIKTGLIANVATTTAFTQLKYIDALSLNHLLVNQAVVNNAHQNGKRVFVWTVDSKSEMQKMMSMGVDNIITNRPDKAAEVVYSQNVGEKVITVLKTIFGTY
jgi:glycerophosphoryl diester phosphodiesterase